MDIDIARAVTLRYLTHRGIAGVVLCLTSIFLMQNEESLLQVIFTIFIMGVFLRSIGKHERFNGYGNAKAINSAIGYPLVTERKLSSGRFAPMVLLNAWRGRAYIYSTLVAFGYLFMVLSDSRFASVLFRVGCIFLMMLLSEIYLWMVADRHRQWYLHESVLVKLLTARRVPTMDIVRVREKLLERGHLMHGVVLY